MTTSLEDPSADRRRRAAAQTPETATAVTVRPRTDDHIEVKIDAVLTVNDIVDMRMVDIENNLRAELEQVSANLSAHVRDRAKLEAKLTAAAAALVRDRKPEARAADLVKALDAFTGDKHLACASGAEQDQQKKTVTTTIYVDVYGKIKAHLKEGDKERYYSAAHEKAVVLPFTADMKELLKQLAAADKDISGCGQVLTAVRTKIANMPLWARQAKARFTKAQLMGKIRSGSHRGPDIVKAMEQVGPALLAVDEPCIGN